MNSTDLVLFVFPAPSFIKFGEERYAHSYSLLQEATDEFLALLFSPCITRPPSTLHRPLALFTSLQTIDPGRVSLLTVGNEGVDLIINNLAGAEHRTFSFLFSSFSIAIARRERLVFTAFRTSLYLVL